MLTLHEPMRLIAMNGMLSLSDAFGERLRSGYDLMTAQFSPKELLHLLTNPPEIPLVDSAQNTFAIDNRFSSRQDILLSVVNNVVNRILCEEHGTLTYQDRVYIEMTLNKLGVTNTQAFMTQVRALREENRSVFRLLNLYRQNIQLMRAASVQETGLNARDAGEAEHGGERKTSGGERRLYLHDRIYDRLETAALYREVHSHASVGVETRATIERNELLTAEQIRVSQLLTLHEMRRELTPVQGEQLVFLRNVYETGELLPPPATEKDVIEQVTAASLVSVIGNVMVSRVEKFLRGGDVWLDVSRAVQQTVENTVSRFAAYHEEHRNVQIEQNRDQSRRISLLNLESTAIERLAADREREIFHTARERIELSLSHRETTEITGAETETVTRTAPPVTVEEVIAGRAGDAVTERETLERLTERQRERVISAMEREALTLSHKETMTVPETAEETFTRAEQPDIAGAMDGSRAPRDGTLERETIQRLITDRRRENVATVTERESLTLSHKETVMAPETADEAVTPAVLSVIRELRDIRHVQNVMASVEEIAVTREAERPIYETAGYTDIRHVTETPPPPDDVTAVTHIDESALIYKTLSAITESPVTRVEGDTTTVSYGGDVIAAAPTVYREEQAAVVTEMERVSQQTGAVVSETVLRERLSEIDRQNRERLETIRSEIAQTPLAEPKPPQIDKKRMLRDALRAIENPEQVVFEAMSAAPTEHRVEHDAGLEAVLSRTDETTRRIFEAVQIYERSPEEAIQMGLLRPGESSAFNADAIEAEREAGDGGFTPAAMELLEAGGGDIYIKDTLGDLLAESGGTGPRAHGVTHSWDAQTMRFVHKLSRQTDLDELQELIETTRRSVQPSVQETVIDKVEDRITQTQINQVTQEVRARTSEEITELVNKTLSRQIGFISDKVYSQLEKRLQGERARRGRM